MEKVFATNNTISYLKKYHSAIAAKSFNPLVSVRKYSVLTLAGLIFLFLSVCCYAVDSPVDPQSRDSFDIHESKLKELSKMATALARTRLSENPKDPKGLLYVKFANHFNPKDRSLLLLRGKLKYKIKVNRPEKEISELEFLSELIKAAESLSDKSFEKNRHLMAVFYAMIREVQPDNEDALIMLTAFEDNGMEVNINKLLSQELSDFRNVVHDPKDSRYVISNVKKTIMVYANRPWTDSWIKVQKGKIIRVNAERMWSMGSGPFPSCDANGYENTDLTRVTKTGSNFMVRNIYIARKKTVTTTKKFKGERTSNPGCLMAKIGKKTYTVGAESVFRAENSGILFFGPYEWDDYSDNSGKLQVTVEVSDM